MSGMYVKVGWPHNRMYTSAFAKELMSIPKDYVTAYKWLNLAQAKGEDPVDLEVLENLPK